MLRQCKPNGFLVIAVMLLWTMSIAAPSYAKGGGSGKGGGHSMGGEHGMGVGDASKKNMTEGTTEGAIPPGLAKEGKMPYGLKKQGKTPAGWSKGKKKGWNKQTQKTNKDKKLFEK
ncbi:MAG: hypothetical protein PHO42_02115 [Candidatus Omnitrophica bacterium]|nr:hypothetical protein [Candidatus Omnitrophota bacterium]